MNGASLRPPRTLRFLLNRLVPPSIREDVTGDLDDKFAARVRRGGRAAAVRWYIGQLLHSFRPATRARLSRIAPSVSTLPTRRDPILTTLTQDLRFALRGLRREPSFTLAVLATLALGIGANTAIFSVIQGVLLAPLPYPDAERIVRIYNSVPEDPTRRDPASLNEAVEYRADEIEGFEAIAAFDVVPAILGGTAEPRRVRATPITHEFAEVFRIAPLLGRLFTREEDRPGSDDVALLSEGLWRDAFGADPGIVGQSIELDGRRRRILGVMPSRFDFYPGFDVLVPRAYDVDALTGETVYSHNQYFIGRLAEGISIEVATEALDRRIASVMQAYPDHNWEHSSLLVPLPEWTTAAVRPTLVALLGAVGLLLLIACANVANLMLARSARRRQEIAVRAALGAGRGRIVRQMLTESVLLAGLGGAAGLALAALLLRVLLAILPPGLPRTDNIALDGAVLGFTLVISLATGLLFGIVPALRVAAADAGGTLRSGGTRLAGGRHGMSTALVVAEVALVAALLLGAGLMLRSVANLASVDPGVEPEGALVFTVELPRGTYPGETEIAGFFASLVDGIARLPGVEAAGSVSELPFIGSPSNWGIEVEGRELPDDIRIPDYHSVVGDYFRAAGIPLLRGRALTPADRETGVVISRRTAELYFPDQDPLGQRIRMSMNPGWRTIVGVVEDYRNRGLTSPVVPTIYLPHVSIDFGSPYITPRMGIAVRTEGDVMALAGPVRERVAALDPEIPVDSLQSMRQAVEGEYASPRFTAVLLGLFAAGALLLGAVGVYGVLAWSVSERTREIGLRQALGADRAAVTLLVLRRGLITVGLGLTIGLLVGYWASRVLMTTMLFETGPADPLALALVVGVLLGVSAVAMAVPAHRAARVDPAIALRGE